MCISAEKAKSVTGPEPIPPQTQDADDGGTSGDDDDDDELVVVGSGADDKDGAVVGTDEESEVDSVVGSDTSSEESVTDLNARLAKTFLKVCSAPVAADMV